MSKRTRSSSRWLAEHESDPYVRQAREQGWRSRAVFKLEEIQRSDRLIRPGMTIVDLGAAPGGWSQFAARLLDGRGRIIALDLLPMPELAGVEFIEGDIESTEVVDLLHARLDGHQADLVMSDMAPNMMGIADVDHARSMNLVDLAVEFAGRELRPGGDLLLKVFQGREFQPLLARLRREFESVKLRKPKASRGRSPEVYVLARGLRLV
jgi:23S rRNA (uridine2552-2'-O)-methyltransferase